MLRWQCPKQHFGKWESSDVLFVKNNGKVFVSDMIVSASILFSENNYAKIKHLFDIINVSIPKQNSFNQIQKLYCVPAVQQYWTEMKESILKVLRNYDDLCLCGDGRNDSPGHTAK